MIAATLNDWKTIRRARREKRRHALEIARRKREIGARALIGFAFYSPDGKHERGYRTGYGREARENGGWGMFV